MKKLLIILSILLFSCDKIVYVDYSADDPGPYVTTSVYHWQVEYIDGVAHVSAAGKVKNHGPGDIWSVRVISATNHGGTSLSGVNPSALAEGEIGDWTVTQMKGTYVKDKYAMFQY